MGISCRQFVIYDRTVEEMKNDIPSQILIHHAVISLQDQDLAYTNWMKYSPDWKREDFCVLVRLHVWPRAAVCFHESSSSLRTDVNKAVKPVIMCPVFFVSFTCTHLLRNVKQWVKTWEKDIFNVLHSKDAIKCSLKCLVMEVYGMHQF